MRDRVTAYHCPVCGDDLLRVQEPEAPYNLVLENAPLEVAIQRAVDRAAREHAATVDDGLRRAVEAHECPHALRWKLWRHRHRRELAEVAT